MRISKIDCQPTKINRKNVGNQAKHRSVALITAPSFRAALSPKELVKELKSFTELKPASESIVSQILKACSYEESILFPESLEAIRTLYYRHNNVADAFMQKILGDNKEKPFPITIGVCNFIKSCNDYLQVDNCKKFILDILNGVKNNKKRDDILGAIGLDFKYFVDKPESFEYYKYTKEEIDNLTKIKCSYKDLVNKSGNLEAESAFEACKLANKTSVYQNVLSKSLKLSKDNDGNITYHNVSNIIGLYWNLELVGTDFLNAVNKMLENPHIKINGSIDSSIIDAIRVPWDKRLYAIEHFGYRTADDIFAQYSKENLYLPQTMCNLLEDLDKNKLITTENADIFDKEIEGYGKLFLMLPDVARNDDNKEVYDKMINVLSKIKGFDFNQKDEHGISFMEKVINSENKQLLDIVLKSGSELTCYPELVLVCEGIQDKSFKKELKNLKFKSESLEKAAQLRSITALKKLSSQLTSPLYDIDDLIINLWKIAEQQEHGINTLQEFGKYICDTYYKEISEETLFTIMNRM